jgi:hypothetical protein
MADPIIFSVDGLGTFDVKPRTLGAQIQIERQYMQELGGSEDGASESLRTLAAIKAQLDILLAVSPEGFVIDDAPVSDVYAIYAEMRSAEERFLGELAEKRQGQGQGA